MPGADDLMMRTYAAMAQKERELIGERTRAALAAAMARGVALGMALGGDRGYRPGFTHEPGGSLTDDRAGRSPIGAIGGERYDRRSSGVLRRAR